MEADRQLNGLQRRTAHVETRREWSDAAHGATVEHCGVHHLRLEATLELHAAAEAEATHRHNGAAGHRARSRRCDGDDRRRHVPVPAGYGRKVTPVDTHREGHGSFTQQLAAPNAQVVHELRVAVRAGSRAHRKVPCGGRSVAVNGQADDAPSSVMGHREPVLIIADGHIGPRGLPQRRAERERLELAPVVAHTELVSWRARIERDHVDVEPTPRALLAEAQVTLGGQAVAEADAPSTEAVTRLTQLERGLKMMDHCRGRHVRSSEHEAAGRGTERGSMSGCA